MTTQVSKAQENPSLGVIMGFLVFGDIPNQMAFTGMIIVIASGLYIVFRERQIGASQYGAACTASIAISKQFLGKTTNMHGALGSSVIGPFA